MNTLVVEIKSKKKARELTSFLADLKYVKRVSTLRKKNLLKSTAAKKSVSLKKKNEKSSLLKQIENGLKDVSKIQSGTIAPKSLSEILDGK